MDRGSNKHSPRVDDQMAGEIRGTTQGTAGGRAQEWMMTEPPGEDQPQSTIAPDGSGRAVSGVGDATGEEFSRFGTYIGLSALPGDRAAIERSARDLQAPDDVLDLLARLPGETTYQNVAEVWRALGR